MEELAPSDLRPSVYQQIDRSEWAALASGLASPLAAPEIAALRGTGDVLDLIEVEQVYIPLSRLLNLYAANARRLERDTQDFLDGAGIDRAATTPFVIGIAGSVAVGKSTIARLLRELLSRWPGTPRVELVTTDGFLYPNAELIRRGILDRKGFPESYDQSALLDFVARVKSGEREARAPRYSHLSYDIVPGHEIVVRRPDVLIIEGLNVLAPAPQGRALVLSDLFDFSVYIDAEEEDIKAWYLSRWFKLQSSAFADPSSYFHRYASLGPEEARETALDIWDRINGVNLVENILPTRDRARLILQKAADHSVERVLLRLV